MTTGCECAMAGYCQRHARRKTEHLHKLCKTDQRYFNYWENPPVREAVQADPQHSFLREKHLELCRSLWLELHRYALDVPQWNPEDAQKWFVEWLKRVPNFGCSCRKHFSLILQEYPLTEALVSREAFFAWTVDRHNNVNQKLSKPQITLAEAIELYGAFKPTACIVCSKPATRICGYTLSMGMCGQPLCDDCTHAHTL